MTHSLEGKTALVTAAGAGIGRASAEALAALGADVIATYIEGATVEDLPGTAERITARCALPDHAGGHAAADRASLLVVGNPAPRQAQTMLICCRPPRPMPRCRRRSSRRASRGTTWSVCGTAGRGGFWSRASCIPKTRSHARISGAAGGAAGAQRAMDLLKLELVRVLGQAGAVSFDAVGPSALSTSVNALRPGAG